ncbi:24234_t:CDS:10, partial [Racocetra persica]
VDKMNYTHQENIAYLDNIIYLKNVVHLENIVHPDINKMNYTYQAHLENIDYLEDTTHPENVVHLHEDNMNYTHQAQFETLTPDLSLLNTPPQSAHTRYYDINDQEQTVLISNLTICSTGIDGIGGIEVWRNDGNIGIAPPKIHEYATKLVEHLKQSDVKDFPYSKFSDLKIIGHGGSAIVYSATFQDENDKKKTYALKSFNNNLTLVESAYNRYCHELKFFNKAHHDNVIEFYGVSKDLNTGNFMMVMQLVDGALIADFGFAKDLQEASHSKIVQNIAKNKREEIIAETPLDYSNLYTKCWSYEPSNRPTLDEIINRLDNITSIEYITNKISKIFDVNRIIKENDIMFCDFSNFSDFDELCDVGEKTLKANLNSEPNVPEVVLKSVDKQHLVEGFNEELKLLIDIAKQNHSNINQFIGIAKDHTKKYFLIHQYANNGNLRNYLKDHFNELTWYMKLKMAFEIASGLTHLHENNIIHKYIHTKNVLVHDGRMVIDFNKGRSPSNRPTIQDALESLKKMQENLQE